MDSPTLQITLVFLNRIQSYTAFSSSSIHRFAVDTAYATFADAVTVTLTSRSVSIDVMKDRLAGQDLTAVELVHFKTLHSSLPTYTTYLRKDRYTL